jgi:hypothetical protein
LPNWNFRGVFSVNHQFRRKDQRRYDGQAGNIIFNSLGGMMKENMPKQGFFAGIFLYVIHRKDQPKLQWAGQTLGNFYFISSVVK